ncbi:PREDICTED: uncharacterized protein LOC106744430 isoform X2 [Dinoponera quadriceps]|nr:PREDICTED: uncharacterized protein LOC106744430 isoform X2 [Dinoponera quadriceps]XP_014474683.1 PREDICTED: uncharacterized protein LOC106744430 isoform X2 [Dinoponera quadriceps]XP_014474684.1 PREDICTED: uncharacterized protein LOC106744430 isoform X2 [Dinoponera quadriceps]XP_014474685.1 PREDICTED: uncharacterized protein LOC106744430 isoform X2 [Dinoponera quadriceps]
MGSKMVPSLLSVLMLNVVLWTTSICAAPLSDVKDPRVASAPVTKCSSDGQCWEWLPTLEAHSDTVLLTDEDGDDTSKLQTRRQITNPASEFAWKSRQDGTLAKAGQVIRPPVPTNKQTPVRIMKKDGFGSRNWGAGGMPFSVLYMNPHYSRSNAATTRSTIQRPESSVTSRSSSSSPGERPNYQRKRQPTVQPRRQPFFTIPQLFLSYGWDAYGK